MVFIRIVHHRNGVSRVHINMGAPLEVVTPAEARRFATKDEARAYAKQLQAELGGPDKSEIVEYDLTTQTALDERTDG